MQEQKTSRWSQSFTQNIQSHIMQYQARLDGLARIITITVMALLAAAIFWSFQEFFETREQEPFFVAAILLIVAVVTYFSKPTLFTLNADELIVYRPHGLFRTPLEKIVRMDRVDRKTLGWGIRIFASGGFFGYLGIFYYGNIGRVSMYCTDRNEMLLVTTEKSRFIISPEHSDDFLAAWKSLSNG